MGRLGQDLMIFVIDHKKRDVVLLALVAGLTRPFGYFGK
jgi:hypothetical protein